MRDFYKYIFLLFFGILSASGTLYAQETDEQPTDDLGNVSDKFQEYFFEALKQKGIENYELALEALKKAKLAAKKNAANEAVVHFEMGKNLKELKRYDEAEENFLKVTTTLGNEQLDVLEAMYDLYYLKKDYAKAIPLVQKLIPLDEDYKEDLANLYHRTRQYDKSLEILDELDVLWGETTYRNALRRQIYRVTGNSEGAIKDLETKIDRNPKKEKDYLNLIYLYSEQGDTTKAFETAKELLKNRPKSKLVHLSLYKFYLDEGNTADAMKSMNVVFGSSEIEKRLKFKVLGDFLEFVGDHPEHNQDLDQVISRFTGEGDGKAYEQLGDFYSAQGKKEVALSFYEKGAILDEDNFSLLKNTLLMQIGVGKYDEAVNLSENGLATFPAQPLLYLINGVANNNLNKPDAAIESLETGIDFLLDNPQMEKDYYEQLGLAYGLKGDQKKADNYNKKAAEINISN